MKTQSEALRGLAVVVPAGELGYSRFWQMLQANRDYCYLAWKGRVLTQSGSYPHAAAQQLVEQAMKLPGVSRILILEHDHEFPADVFQKHAAYTQPVVAGMYVMRDIEAPLPVFYEWDDARNNIRIPNAAKVNDMLTKPGLYEMDVVPMGCTSIRRDVLEKWPKDRPYFSSYINPAGAAISHDVFFCRVAQDNGWTLYLDTSLEVAHFVLVPIGMAYFKNWWAQVGAKAAIKRAEEEAKP